LTLNTTTEAIFAEIDQAKDSIMEMQATISVIEENPYSLSIEEISPDYVAQSEIIDELLARGRSQYLNGDYDGASTTFKEVEARDANNAEAKLFQTRIAEILGAIHKQNFYKTRQQMLTEVEQNWERPKVFDIDKEVSLSDVVESGILQKMKEIIIPQVNFSGMELTRVIDTLSELSVEYDPNGQGVNIVPLFDPNERNPRVNISLRNLNLDLILKFVTQQVNFSYDVGGDAVTVDFTDASGGESSNLTEFFPISRATIIRLTGIRGGSSGSIVSSDPFAEQVESFDSGASDDTDALKTFFQSAGVNFDLPGVDLAFDGEQLIVTQTSRNLERLRVILRNYNEIKQVEIEAKFLEVSQGDLEELGFDWNLGEDGDTIFQFGAGSGSRGIADVFGVNQDSSQITIDNPGATLVIPQGDDPPLVLSSEGFSNPIPFLPPNITNAVDLGAEVVLDTFEKAFSLGNYDVDFAIRALSRQTGSDLMSAPKVTVLSGKRATIKVAQELRYPESYGDIEAEVSAGVDGGGGSGGAGIAITAGTPQDFVTRNVGVEMSVTPNVENDDTISLILEPRVTEFEGFVEYGGPSVAIQGGTTVTVPSGFYQPIFSVREVTTEVTVFDGATIVMGGLTRDEVKTVKDKVPFLGDIPGIGRLFRSEGETRLKRNLLIFVTANLVSPGGSPANQNYRNVNANSLFQNPTIMTPSGAVNRSIEAPETE
jgi:general secretion pathway protein D